MPRVALAPEQALDLPAARRALADAPALELLQAWREAPEPAFRPGCVRFGWIETVSDSGPLLLVLAELEDEDIHNPATRFNDPRRNTGDFFEMIFRPAGQDAYYELHVTPTNFRSQFRFPDADFVKRFREERPGENVTDHVKVDEPLFDSAAEIARGKNRWSALAAVPLGRLCEAGQGAKLRELTFACCRSDFTRGVETPQMSCTNRCAAINWHEQHEWMPMTLRD